MVTFSHREKMSGTKRLFNLTGKGITRTSGWKLRPDKFKLEERSTFLTVR